MLGWFIEQAAECLLFLALVILVIAMTLWAINHVDTALEHRRGWGRPLELERLQ